MTVQEERAILRLKAKERRWLRPKIKPNEEPAVFSWQRRPQSNVVMPGITGKAF